MMPITQEEFSSLIEYCISMWADIGNELTKNGYTFNDLFASQLEMYKQHPEYFIFLKTKNIT